MLKYLTKLAMEIFPSVLATIIGAYIVNHYISARPATDSPVAAVASTDPKKVDAKTDPAKTDPKSVSTEVASLPEPGVKAKGISEKSILGKAAIDAPKGAAESLYEKLVDKPTETSVVPADPRHNPTAQKPIAKTTPAAPVAPAVVAAPAAPAAPAETASVPDDHRDAADLARAALERLQHANGETPSRQPDAVRAPEPPRAQEAVRAPEPPRGQDTPRVVAAPPVLPTASPIRPLPPPITVGGAGPDATVASVPMQNPPYTGAIRNDDSGRPTPPADIPPPPPMNLHADLSPREQAKQVAQDMLSAARSVFHAVLPHPRREED